MCHHPGPADPLLTRLPPNDGLNKSFKLELAISANIFDQIVSARAVGSDVHQTPYEDWSSEQRMRLILELVGDLSEQLRAAWYVALFSVFYEPIAIPSRQMNAREICTLTLEGIEEGGLATEILVLEIRAAGSNQNRPTGIEQIHEIPQCGHRIARLALNEHLFESVQSGYNRSFSDQPHQRIVIEERKPQSIDQGTGEYVVETQKGPSPERNRN